jgi:hypothetical protein
MGAFLPLSLKTEDGRPLPHQYYEGDAAGLLIVLPGLHYGPDGPALYLTGKLLQRAGWDLLGLTYGFQTDPQLAWTERLNETLAETKTAIAVALGRRHRPLLGVVGKSLGSLLLAQLCGAGSIPKEARLAYLTPPIGNPFFDDGFAASTQSAYLAIGTADNFYNPEALQSLRDRRPFLARVLQGADHGLDVVDDLPATLRVVGQVAEDCAAFMRFGEVPGLESP